MTTTTTTAKQDEAIMARRQRATARFMLRVIAAETAHGVVRPDREAFTARMERQAADRASR